MGLLAFAGRGRFALRAGNRRSGPESAQSAPHEAISAASRAQDRSIQAFVGQWRRPRADLDDAGDSRQIVKKAAEC